MKPLAVGALPTRPHAWSPTTSPARSAASQTLWWRGLPYGASVRTGSSRSELGGVARVPVGAEPTGCGRPSGP